LECLDKRQRNSSHDIDSIFPFSAAVLKPARLSKCFLVVKVLTPFDRNIAFRKTILAAVAGGPVASTSNGFVSDHVCKMGFDTDRITVMTRVWKGVFKLQQPDWA
jgi:hypothetical protein